jgi:hypothetical protein
MISRNLFLLDRLLGDYDSLGGEIAIVLITLTVRLFTPPAQLIISKKGSPALFSREISTIRSRVDDSFRTT